MFVDQQSAPPRRRFARASIATLALAALLALAGCGNKSDLKLLDETLKAYQSALRWADVNETLRFIDPDKREEFEPTSFDRERWKQVKIGSLRAQPPTPIGETRMQQVIQLDLINVNTQAVRSVSVLNEWRYDAEAEKWWLMNGLPKIDR